MKYINCSLLFLLSFIFCGYPNAIISGTLQIDNNSALSPDITVRPIDTLGEATESVFIFKQGKVCCDGIVLTEDNQLVENITVLDWGKEVRDHPLLQYNSTDFTDHKFDGCVAVIASSGSENYYHWLFQILPRIKILAESSVCWDKLYFYNLNKPYQWDTLRRLGITAEDVLLGRPGQIWQADILVVPSIPVWPAKNKLLPNWVINYLNNNFIPNPASCVASKKIWISRRKAQSRNIINEEALEAFLINHGYEPVVLEDLAVEQQALLFKRTQSVVGVHGSGLSNIVFCTPGTNVIEIDPHDGHRGPYRSFARKLGLNYTHVPTSGEKLSDDQKKRDDVYVDLDEFAAILTASSGRSESIEGSFS